VEPRHGEGQTYVKRGFRCAVVGVSWNWNQRKTGRSVHQRGLVLLLLQVWQDCSGQVDVRGIVGLELLIECVQIDALWFGKVEVTLDSTVDKDAVNVRVRLHDALCEAWDLVELGNVELNRLSLVLSMLLHKLVEVLLSTASDNDLDVIIDELGGECLSNTGSGSEHEDLLVDELTGHVVDLLYYTVSGRVRRELEQNEYWRTIKEMKYFF